MATTRLTEGTERDLTEAFLDYREAMRHLWNAHVRHAPDAWHDFINVDDALFYALVLAHLDDDRRQRDHHYYPALHVRFAIPPIGWREVLARREVGPPHNHWEPLRLTQTDIHLRYIGLFDFREHDDRWEARYVEAQVRSCRERTDLVGCHMLLEATDVRIVCVDGPGPPESS